MAATKLSCTWKLQPRIEKQQWHGMSAGGKTHLETLQSTLLSACSLPKQVKLSSSREMACPSVAISPSILLSGVWKMPRINIGWANVSKMASNVGGYLNASRHTVAIVGGFRFFVLERAKCKSIKKSIPPESAFCFRFLTGERKKWAVSTNCHANSSLNLVELTGRGFSAASLFGCWQERKKRKEKEDEKCRFCLFIHFSAYIFERVSKRGKAKGTSMRQGHWKRGD